MYQYIKHKDIDYGLWDECIDNSENGMIYALSWYLDIAAPGWDGIIKEEDGKYVVVMPIPVFRKFGIKYIKQPLFCQQLGIYPRNNKRDEISWSKIANILQSKFSYILSYSFNYHNRFPSAETTSKIKTTDNFTLHLNLNRPYEEVIKGYKRDRKWRINKAKRAKLKIVASEDIGALISIFHKNVAFKIYGVSRKSYETLKNLYYATKSRNLCALHAVKNDQEEIIAMGLFFTYKHKIIYIFNASTTKGKKLNAISLLIDYVIKKNANQDLHFDFEAPEKRNIYEFYSRFGGTPIPFVSISLNNLPPHVELLKDLRFRFYRKFINSPNEIQQ